MSARRLLPREEAHISPHQCGFQAHAKCSSSVALQITSSCRRRNKEALQTPSHELLSTYTVGSGRMMDALYHDSVCHHSRRPRASTVEESATTPASTLTGVHGCGEDSAPDMSREPVVRVRTCLLGADEADGAFDVTAQRTTILGGACTGSNLLIQKCEHRVNGDGAHKQLTMCVNVCSLGVQVARTPRPSPRPCQY